jgi:hypothetical protein
MKENLEKILAKIRKLKNLYESAKKIDSEGEACQAAKAIRNLLLEYNLTMEEVEMSQDASDKEEIVQESASGYDYKSIGGYWEYELTSTICRYNLCRCYMLGNTYKNLVILGKEQNIKMVRWTVDMLKERLVALSKDRFKEFQKQCLDNQVRPYSKDKFQRNYLMGCVDGLRRKLKEERDREKAQEEEQASKITSLVVCNDAAIDEYTKKTWGQTKTRNVRYESNNARNLGYKDGRNIELNNPIEGNVGKKSLLG